MVLAPRVTDLLPAAADSARAVAHIYTVSLSVLVPLGIAGVAAVALRDSRAQARVAIWRAAIVALVVVFLGGLLPVHTVAWVVPAGLASPLILLGRMQVGMPITNVLASESLADSGESLVVRLLLVVYLAGALAVLTSLAVATVRIHGRIRRAVPVRDPRLLRLLAESRIAAGAKQAVRLVASTEFTVPMTWGLVRPAILLPVDVREESDDRVRAVLIHELCHITARDSAFAITSRIACSLLWFHPAAWWLDRRLRADCEIACDDRVLAGGIRQSDYAELLVDTCDRIVPHRSSTLALAICQPAGLRQRLGAILDPSRERRRASRLAGSVAVTLTLLVALPASFTQLAPTRSVLDGLMREHRWESRAYAVLGLAQRPDSIAVAWVAASSDPDPKVRAWAHYALSLEPITVAAPRAAAPR